MPRLYFSYSEVIMNDVDIPSQTGMIFVHQIITAKSISEARSRLEPIPEVSILDEKVITRLRKSGYNGSLEHCSLGEGYSGSVMAMTASLVMQINIEFYLPALAAYGELVPEKNSKM